MKHALVIGGTGMLSNVSLWLACEGYHVSVIGRNPQKMNSLITKCIDESLITPLLVDYRNENELREKIKIAIQKSGHLDVVVAWIHSNAENALEIVLQAMSNNNHNWKLFHVLGSRANLIEISRNIEIPDGCQYHQVQLGYILEKGNSRWLTNDEIADGVIDSIKSDKLINIVGTIEPWEKRP